MRLIIIFYVHLKCVEIYIYVYGLFMLCVEKRVYAWFEISICNFVLLNINYIFG